MSSNSGKVLSALIAGALVGVGIGVLVAPDKGSATRKKLREGFDDTKDDVVEKIAALVISFFP